MRNLLINTSLISVFLLVLSVWLMLLVSCDLNREKRLMSEGEGVINKIELYIEQNNKLPNSLEDLGLIEQDGYDVIYYEKRDSLCYTVSFPISAEEHLFYYSDTETWEKGYRVMPRAVQ